MAGLPPGDYKELQHVLGDVLQVAGYKLAGEEGTIIWQHAADLDRFPKPLLSKMVREGLQQILIGPGSVAEFPGYEALGKEQVPGYPRGTTWLDIAGAYDRKTQTVILGPRPVVDEHLAVHEVAHALIDLLGYVGDFRVDEEYRRLFPELHDFYKIGHRQSTRGKVEFLADSVAYVILYQDVTPSNFHPEFLRFIRETMLTGRTPRAK
ncbi:MAG: hypothetical protein HY706_14560 [Candidatus Hydrogenedentes bacterium]|nr:hypothetical protein [Candidatus Hydrogenedentota bacterium]